MAWTAAPPIIVSHWTGPHVALHCFSLPQFPHLEGSLHFLDLLSPELAPCQPGGEGGQTLKYVKGSILVRTMEVTGDIIPGIKETFLMKD